MKKIILGLLAIALLFLAGCTANSNVIAKEASSQNIEIDLSEISTTAKFYTYDSNGVEVRYFVVLGKDGEPRVSFDACDVCGGSKGYRQEGDKMVCNNCGQRFSIDGLGTENKGYGCWPSHLDSAVENGKIIINTADLQAGESRFV